jgi:hypothetical protein
MQADAKLRPATQPLRKCASNRKHRRQTLPHTTCSVGFAAQLTGRSNDTSGLHFRRFWRTWSTSTWERRFVCSYFERKDVDGNVTTTAKLNFETTLHHFRCLSSVVRATLLAFASLRLDLRVVRLFARLAPLTRTHRIQIENSR